MHFTEYLLEKLTRQFAYTNIYMINLFKYRIYKRSVFSVILDIIYNIILSILFFALVECAVYFFFGSLPIYAFTELYSIIRPESFMLHDKSTCKLIYLATTIFCILFEAFSQCTILYTLLLQCYRTSAQSSLLYLIGSGCFYAVCLLLGMGVHKVLINYIGDLLDLLDIQTTSGKVGLASICLFLIVLIEKEARGVYNKIDKKKAHRFNLLLYLGMLVISLIMMLIWFGVDFGVPLFTHTLELGRGTFKELLNEY